MCNVQYVCVLCTVCVCAMYSMCVCYVQYMCVLCTVCVCYVQYVCAMYRMCVLYTVCVCYVYVCTICITLRLNVCVILSAHMYMLSSALCNAQPTRACLLRCVGTYVYDITDWCRCGGLLQDAQGNPVRIFLQRERKRLKVLRGCGGLLRDARGNPVRVLAKGKK